MGVMTDQTMQPPSREARAAALDLGDFVAASPSSFHAVRESERRLREAGFTPLDETAPWTGDAVRGNHYVVRDGAIIAWSAGADASEQTPWRIVGSHTDSPALKLKPNPQLGAEGFAQVGVEIYGGTLLNTWLDRDLRLAGRLLLRGGTEVLVDTPPLLRVPQLAVHLDRAVNKNGLVLDPQRHMQPIIGQGEVDVIGVLAERAGVDREDVLGMDVVTVDTQAPALLGAHEEFLASGRLDNLSSMHAETQALITVAGGERSAGAPIALMVANDHEEVGSATRSGAAGPFLEDVLVRIHHALGGSDATLRQTYAQSVVVSADAGHAAHPNYAERHDPVTHPRLNGGPMLKVNADQRYATDARGTAVFIEACEQAGVPHQTFVSNNAMPCGSTIGPITATRLGMLTVDVGIALLSMHSAREMCGAADPLYMQQALAQFLRG